MATQKTQEVTLKRVLGFWPVFATSVGLVVSSTCMVTLGNSVGLAGPAFLIPAAIAGVIVFLVSMSYSELAGMIPSSGMIASYTLPALGRLPAMFAVLAGYVVLIIAAGSTESLIVGEAIHGLVPLLSIRFVGLAMLIGFLVANLLGVDVFGRVQVIVVVSMLIILSALGLVGLLGIGGGTKLPDVPFNPGGWSGLANMVALGMWLYLGIEYACPLAEEIKEPERTIPRAMAAGIVAILISNMLFGIAITQYVPLDKLASSTIPHVLGASAIMGKTGIGIVALITLLAGASSIDSHMASIPRMLYGMSRDGMLPKCFQWLHPRYRTPWVGIFVVFACLAYLIIVTELTVDLFATLILSACTCWLLSYIIAQLDVIVLRFRYPGRHRPYKTPLYPVPQVVGLIFCVYMILTIHPDPVVRTSVFKYAGLFCAAIIAYGIYRIRFVMKKPLFTPVPLEAVVEEVCSGTTLHQ